MLAKSYWILLVLAKREQELEYLHAYPNIWRHTDIVQTPLNHKELASTFHDGTAQTYFLFLLKKPQTFSYIPEKNKCYTEGV